METFYSFIFMRFYKRRDIVQCFIFNSFYGGEFWILIIVMFFKAEMLVDRE